MAVTFKITPVGGYIIGDGPVPADLNPDQFMKLFMSRVLEAKARGATELVMNDTDIAMEIREAIARGILQSTEAAITYCNEVWDAGQATTIEGECDTNRILNALPDVIRPQINQPQQIPGW